MNPGKIPWPCPVQHRRIERAPGRFGHQAVLEAIASIARGDDRGINRGELRCGDERRPVAGGEEIRGEQRRGAGEVGSGRPRNDAVIVLWKALRLHQRLTSSIRAAGEIGILRRLSIEGANERLGFVSGLMDGAVSVIDNFLRMAKRPLRVRAAGLVTGIRGRCCIPHAQRGGQLRVSDRAGEPAIADTLVFAVPAGGGHPDFELDV